MTRSRRARDSYLILGTVDRKVWQNGLTGSGTPLDHLLEQTAELRKRYDLHHEPGGWYPPGTR
jgi:hypothetical protein